MRQQNTDFDRDEEKRKIKIKRDVKFEEQNRKRFQNIKYDKTINLLDSEEEEEEEEETEDNYKEEKQEDDEFEDVYNTEEIKKH